jgi:hypothetical protein
MKARVSQLNNTTEGWDKIIAQYEANDTVFVPNAGELIVYTPSSTCDITRLKIGDGVTALKNLPFLVEANLPDALKGKTIDAGRI